MFLFLNKKKAQSFQWRGTTKVFFASKLSLPCLVQQPQELFSAAQEVCKWNLIRVNLRDTMFWSQVFLLIFAAASWYAAAMDGEWEIGDFAISIGKSLKYGFFLPSSFIFPSPLSRLHPRSPFSPLKVVRQLPFSLFLLLQTFFRAFPLLYRVLKILGCKHGCHDGMRAPVRQQSSVGSQIPISTCETLRNRGVALLSRLLWYDKKQFRQFLANLVESRDLTFLMPFLHGYLTFCGDPQNPFSTVVTSTSAAASTGGGGLGGGGHSNSKLYCFLFMRDPYLCTLHQNSLWINIWHFPFRGGENNSAQVWMERLRPKRKWVFVLYYYFIFRNYEKSLQKLGWATG